MKHHFCRWCSTKTWKKNTLSEQTVFIHAVHDNWVGQNKNNTLLECLAWRICQQKNKNKMLSFISEGYTKSTYDGVFRLLNKSQNNSRLSMYLLCLNWLIALISLCPQHMWILLHCYKWERRSCYKMYYWQKFLHTNGAKKVPLTIQYNHFEFDIDYKG